MIGGQFSALYDDEGNARQNRNKSKKLMQEAWSVMAIAPSTPFAMAELLPPEVWNGVSMLLKHAK